MTARVGGFYEIKDGQVLPRIFRGVPISIYLQLQPITIKLNFSKEEAKANPNLPFSEFYWIVNLDFSASITVKVEGGQFPICDVTSGATTDSFTIPPQSAMVFSLQHAVSPYVIAIPAALTSQEPTGGTVTSVGISAPADMQVTNTPITSAGTITLERKPQAANVFLAGPGNGSDAEPTYRKLVQADLPPPAPVAANAVYAGPTGGGNAAPTYRKLVAADLPTPSLKGYTVATLPAGAEGDMAYVTDGIDTAAWGVKATGGGTKKLPVFYNGVDWIFM